MGSWTLACERAIVRSRVYVYGGPWIIHPQVDQRTRVPLLLSMHNMRGASIGVKSDE